MNDVNQSLDVWLIEDDRIYGLLFEKALSSALTEVMPYTFKHVDDGGTALELLTTTSQAGKDLAFPDLIFLDHRMPVMDGWEVLQELKKSASTQCIPVCMISSSSCPKEQRLCYSLGASLCTTKPLDYKQLGPKLKLICQLYADVLQIVH